jgi:hypothetical protein
MIRKHAMMALAMLAFGLVVAAPAEAASTAGAGGVKKNATVKVKNNTVDPYYVLVIPNSLAASTKYGTPGTVGWAKKLGGVLVNPGRTITYPVPSGPGQLFILAPAALPANNNAPLPAPAAGGLYNVGAGRVVTKTIAAGPVIQ